MLGKGKQNMSMSIFMLILSFLLNLLQSLFQNLFQSNKTSEKAQGVQASNKMDKRKDKDDKLKIDVELRASVQPLLFSGNHKRLESLVAPNVVIKLDESKPLRMVARAA